MIRLVNLIEHKGSHVATLDGKIPTAKEAIPASTHLPCPKAGGGQRKRREAGYKTKQSKQQKPWEIMKNIELMTLSPPCTAVLTMEISLPLISRKSEQDSAASSVGSQSLHYPMSRKYVDSPAIPKLTPVLPAACSHTSSWLGSLHLYVIIREERM